MRIDSSRPPRVAVIDDDENIGRSFGRLLRAGGMESVAFLSAEAFLAQNRLDEFDCLVLDIQLPGMSGLELQEHLHADGIATPIVFITGYDDADARAMAKAAGCAGYFRKSDPGSEVLEAIRCAVSRSPAA
jgi:FixJ family two-component response regulator